MPEWIHDISCWLFHQDHSADWWMVGLTALLLLAAAIAGSFARNAWVTAEGQLESMEKARREAVQPLVHMRNACLTRNGGALYFAIRVKNVGVGPARGVEVLAWPATPISADAPWSEWEPALEAAKLQVNVNDPLFYVRPMGAMGVDEHVDVLLSLRRLPVDGERWDSALLSARGALLYTIKYSDIHDTAFPRVARLEGKHLGSVKLNGFKFEIDGYEPD